MTPITFYLRGNMPLIYFIYGLSFLVLGFIALSGKERRSNFAFARILWLLGSFALVHGLHEWIEIFHLGYSGEGLLIQYYFALCNLALLVISYFFLFQFGVELIRQHRPMRLLSFLPGLSMAVLFISLPFVWRNCAEHGIFSMPTCLEILARYLLGLPGSLTAAIGFMLLQAELRKSGWERRSRNMRGAAVFFVIYGFAGGLVTPACTVGFSHFLNYDAFFDHLGLPVQLVRALAAFFITLYVGNSLTIFDQEQKEQEEEERKELALYAERNRIAMELHDGVQQILFSIGIQAESYLMRTTDEAAKEKMKTIRDLAQRGISEIRSTVLSLRKQQETEKSIEEAVSAVAHEVFAESSVPVEIRFHGKDKYPVSVESVIFRFFQEGLVNIYKHAAATRVELGLEDEETRLELWLWDNGVGLPKEIESMADFVKGGSVGLAGMEERLKKLGGDLSFERPSAGGTLLRAHIPLEVPAEAPQER